MSSKVYFHYQTEGLVLRDRGELKLFLEGIFRRQKKKLDHLHIIFCPDAYLLGVNLQFLGHDFYTDIISFELSAAGEPVQGEIYISTDRVRENARDFKTSFQQEVHRVIFHGVLHLCGYKDKSPKDSALMRKMEDKYLGLYFA
jgi:probable rRNA maturation factor